MHKIMKKARATLNVTVASTTMLWSIGFSAFVPVAHAAADVKAGDLIRGNLTPAVYYYGADGKRYVFPNEKTYKSWYADFSAVKHVSDADLQALPIGGNVTYRPGVKMVKITTDPKVYAVDAGGKLRWIKDEATATALYGADWSKNVEDVPDAFFVNYTSGTNIAAAASFDKAAVTAAASAINVDKGLAAGATGTTGGALSLSLASDTPPASTAPYLSGDVIFSKVVLSAGSTAVSVKSVKVARYGLSADADLSSVKLYVGTVQQGTNQTFDAQHKASFVLTTPIAIDANSSKTVTIAGDIAATGTAVSGNQVMLGIDSAADIGAGGATVNGSFPIRGNAVTISAATIGTLSVAAGPDNPSSDISPDVGKKDLKIFQMRLTAGSTEDVEVTQIVALKGGTHVPTDVKDLKLYNDTSAKLENTVSAWNADSRAVFDLNPSILLTKGNSVNLSILVGEVLAGSARTISATLEKSGTTFTGVRARGKTYNLGIVPTGAFAGTATAQTISAGSLTVVKSASSPATGNIAPGANDVPLAAFDMVVRGESVRTTGSTTFSFTLGSSLLISHLTACTLRDSAGNVVAGPIDPTGTTAVYSTTLTFPVGTNTYPFRCNISSSATANGTVAVSVTPSTGMTVQGVTSGNSISLSSQSTAVTANTLTVQGGALAVRTEATPPATSIVPGQSSVPLANILLDTANSGEDVRVSSVAVQNTRVGAGADNSDWQNLALYDENGTRLTDITQPATGLAAGSTKTTLTLTTPITVSKATTKRLVLKADYKAGIGAVAETHTWAVAAVGDVAATGVSTGSAITLSAATGAGQAMTFAATGTLTAALDSSNPSSDVIIAGQTSVPMLAMKLTGATEDIRLQTIKLTRSSAGQGADSDFNKITLYDGTTKLGEGRLSSGTYTFDIRALDYLVAKNATKVLSVKADFNRVVGAGGNEGAISGNQDKLSLAATTDLVANGQASGTTVNASATVTGNDMFLRRTKLSVARNAAWIAPTTPSGGGSEVLRLDLTATGAPGDQGAGVKFAKGVTNGTFAAGDGRLRFSISQSGGTATGVTTTLTRALDNTVLHTNTGLDTTGATDDYNFGTAALTVAPGTTETVIVRVDLTQYATTGEFFQLRLVAETSDALAAGDNVRWDDLAPTTGMTAGHVNTSHADFNGFRVPGLDLNGPVLKV